MPYSNSQYLQSLTNNQQLKLMKVDFFSDKKLNVIEQDNAYVLPPKFGTEDTAWFIGGVLDSNRNYIRESGQYAYGEKNRVFGQYDFNENEVNYIDEEVLYFNFYLSQWGHYLLDVIGRLWYIANHSDYKIVYTTDYHGDNHIKNNFLQLLKLLGINEDRLVFINEVTKFKKVIIPETSILIAKYWTKEYKEIINKLINNALDEYDLKENRKIYCSRKHFNEIRSLSFNEELIEQIYKDNGYEIVYMEELDLIEQIRLLNECKEIACISGTLVHNAMFIINKKCNFTVINKTYKVNPNIYLTNQISNATFTFVDAYLAPLPISIGKGPFILVLSNELIDYCKDKDLKIDKIDKKISRTMLVDYYFEYIKKYRKKILNKQKISTSGFEEYDVDDKGIKQHYKHQLSIINK